MSLEEGKGYVDLGGGSLRRDECGQNSAHFTKFLKELVLKSSLKSCNMGRRSMNNVCMRSACRCSMSHTEGQQQGASPSVHHVLNKSVQDDAVYHVTYSDQPATDSPQQALVFRTMQEPGQRFSLPEAGVG